MKGGEVTGVPSLKSRRQPGKLQSFSESRRGPILPSPEYRQECSKGYLASFRGCSCMRTV